MIIHSRFEIRFQQRFDVLQGDWILKCSLKSFLLKNLFNIVCVPHTVVKISLIFGIESFLLFNDFLISKIWDKCFVKLKCLYSLVSDCIFALLLWLVVLFVKLSKDLSLNHIDIFVLWLFEWSLLDAILVVFSWSLILQHELHLLDLFLLKVNVLLLILKLLSLLSQSVSCNYTNVVVNKLLIKILRRHRFLW